MGIDTRHKQPQKVKKGPNLGRLHIHLLIRSKIAAWYDFCHTKNLEICLCPLASPINTIELIY